MSTQIKLSKINTPKVKVKDNKKPYADRKCPHGFENFHHRLMVLFGSVGRGKTTAIIEWIMMMKTTNSYDKYFYVSPSIEDEEKKHNIDDDTLEIIPTYSDDWLIKIQEWIKQEIKEYKIYQEYYKVYKHCIIEGHDPNASELMLLSMHGFEEPKTKYVHGHPCFAFIFDDQIGEKALFSPSNRNPFTKFLVKCRHMSSTILISVQLYKGGLPKTLRSGMVYSWLLFPTNAASHRKAIAEELADRVENIEAFDYLWNYATKDNPWDFLYVDYGTFDPSKRFRKNFHTQLQLEAPPDDLESSL